MNTIKLPLKDKETLKLLERALKYDATLNRDREGNLFLEFYLKNGKVIKYRIEK